MYFQFIDRSFLMEDCFFRIINLKTKKVFKVYSFFFLWMKKVYKDKIWIQFIDLNFYKMKKSILNDLNYKIYLKMDEKWIKLSFFQCFYCFYHHFIHKNPIFILIYVKIYQFYLVFFTFFPNFIVFSTFKKFVPESNTGLLPKHLKDLSQNRTRGCDVMTYHTNSLDL